MQRGTDTFDGLGDCGWLGNVSLYNLDPSLAFQPGKVTLWQIKNPHRLPM
jgi:hypothetical protein